MKVSYTWLKDYLDINIAPEVLSDMLTAIGLEVEGMEEVESVPGGLKGLVVGHVKTCDQHPNADRLSLTTVDVGEEEDLQIVCGAPNVAAGQKVIVATVGTMLYPNSGEPFKIKKGKIRGEVSQGMICAEDEIGLGESHDGIMVLDEKTAIGMEASQYFDLESDVVFDIGLTPNRSDATCHLGVAKDVLAYLRVNENYSKDLKLPNTSELSKRDNEGVTIEVENEIACPRYAGVVIKNIKVGPSPDWLKKRLNAIDVRPINNVVDITNFVLHEMGQPLHAFDLKQIEGETIRVKTLEEGTPFVGLDEQERKLRANDLMICDANSKPLCMAGVFGGLGSGVTDQTTSIFLESAHFNASYVRTSSMKHNLRTDAAKVFEKGSDPSIVVDALHRAAQLIVELAGGEVASRVQDHYPKQIEKKQIEVDFNYINRLIGTDLSPEDIRRILEAMDMEILKEDEIGLLVAVPTNKSDVHRPADLVEEILRIYGLNNVPIPNTFKMSVNVAKNPDPRAVLNNCSDLLVGNGFFEMMAVSLTESRFFKDILPLPEEELVYVNNTSNVQLDVMRPNMLFSGLQAIAHNQNRQNPNLRLFEFGRSYRKIEEQFVEKQHLTLFMTGKKYDESWIEKESEVDYYDLKAMVNILLSRLGLSGLQEQQFSDERFAYGLSLGRGPQVFAEIGLVKSKLAKAMGIKNAVYYADFNWDLILRSIGKHKVHFTEISKYPRVRRDLALVVDNSVKFKDIVIIANKTAKKLLKNIRLFDVYSNEEQLGKGKKSYAISLVFEDVNKTLNDKEIDKIMNQLIGKYEKSLSALIRK